MRIIAKKTLRDFWEQHPDAEQALKAWFQDAKQATWVSPASIRQTYATASILAHNRVVFNIRGNTYRLIVAINYAYGIIYSVLSVRIRPMIRWMRPPSKRENGMDIRPIKTEADYQHTLALIETLFDAHPNTPEGDRLEILTTLIEAYEAIQYPIDPPDPIEAIIYTMESRGLTRRDLEPYFGSRGRVSEVLNRKRPLSLEMIRQLHHGLGIAADVLIQPYPLLQSAA